MKTPSPFALRQLAPICRATFGTLALVIAAAPTLLLAQYSEMEMGEYLHYAFAAANGGVYAGIDGIGYTGIFGTPSFYKANTGWVDLPVAQGFNTGLQIYGTTTASSHDGGVLAGSVTGTTPGGVSKQAAACWVDGVESVIPAPPDDPGSITMSATAVSGDGTTLLVQDGTPYSATVETFVYNIATGTFTSLGFLGSANHQTYATAINGNGTVVAGYSSLDNGNISGFTWNASTGMTVLAIPANHPNTSYLEPTCMSDDGTTLYGRLTEGGGWVGFRYNTTTGYQDLGEISPSACTADGTEAVGIENLYFPAVWSVGNGSGYLDHLLSANGIPQALGTLSGPVTISPDGSAITASGPDAHLVDQIWLGVWQISLPSPLKTAAIPPAKLTFMTDYQTTLTEPAGTLTQSAEFNAGASATLVTGPHYASAFMLNADGSFTYTPKPGYISAGVDPENGTPTDAFTYHLVSPNGTSAKAQVQITVLAPTPPTVASPTYANLTITSATLGGTVTDSGGATVTVVGVVFAPTAVDSNPQIGDPGVSTATGTATTGVFTVNVSGLTPGTDYSFAAYATNSLGIGYSALGSFSTPAIFYLETTENSPANLDAAKLASQGPSESGSPLAVTAVSFSSTQGGSVAMAGGIITYTPPNNFVGSDTFTYTLYDSGLGANLTGTAMVSVDASSGNGPSVVSITLNAGLPTISFTGIPGFTYAIQASADMVNWSEIGTVTAGSNGLFQFTDANANRYSARYYRTSAP